MNYKTIILIIIITLIIYFLIKNTKITEKFTLYNSYGAIEFVDKNTSERLYTFPPPRNNFDNYVTDNNIDVTEIKIEQGIKGKPGNDATLPEPPLCNNVIDGIEKIKPKSGNIINLPDINLNNQTINITNNLCIGDTDEKNCINYNKLSSLNTSNSILNENIGLKRTAIVKLNSNIDVCDTRKEHIKHTSNLMINKIGYVSNEDCDTEYAEKEESLNTQYYHKKNGPSYEFLPEDEKNKIKQRNEITICDISEDELEDGNYYLKQNNTIDCSDQNINNILSLDYIFQNKFEKVEESQNFKDNYIKTTELTPDKLNIDTKQIKSADKYINKFNIDSNYRYVNPEKVNEQITNLSDDINLDNDALYNTAYDIIKNSSNWKRKIDTTNETEDVYYYDQNNVFDKLKECKYYKNRYLTSNYNIEDITNWQEHYCKLNDNCIKIGDTKEDNTKYMKTYDNDSITFNYYDNKLTNVESNMAIRNDKCSSNCRPGLINKSEISLDDNNHITTNKNDIAVYKRETVQGYATYYDKLSEEELDTLKFENWRDKDSSLNDKLLTNEEKRGIHSYNNIWISDKKYSKEIYDQGDEPFINEHKLEYLNKYNDISSSKQYMIFNDYDSYKRDPVHGKTDNDKQFVYIKEKDIDADYKYLHNDTNNNVNIYNKNEELQKLNIAVKDGDKYELYIWNEVLNSNIKLTENDMNDFKEELENYNNSKSCDEGMFYNSRTQECEEKKCKCMYGENYAANGINCPNNGDEKCVYKCPNGTPKYYPQSQLSKINRCSSCNSGFTKRTGYIIGKKEDICIEDKYQACKCNNGYAYGKNILGLTNLNKYYSCTAEEPNKCSSCKFGYTKKEDKCSRKYSWLPW
tara:strand:+ start:6939 stop:9521 length:2583 start_codon:yes stop_codon:yes gene_type:complete